MKNYYINKGYNFTKYGDEFEVKVEDLSKGSDVLVEIKCDNPYCEHPYLKPISWSNYNRILHKDGKYYCMKCANDLFARKSQVQTKLQKSKSFEQWCIENNRQDILERWNYELNDKKPNEICYGTDKKYWFKCLVHFEHDSELKSINKITCGRDVLCNQCNSFAQWGIDNLGDDFLDKYWSNKNIINPWNIDKCSHKKIWIICQEKDYHGDYQVQCNNFVNHDYRCPYCSHQGNKIHPLDSLGKLLEDNNLLNIWSDKNDKSPYEYAPYSLKEVWWKCLDGMHEDYLRTINSSNNMCNFRCPECQHSKGEKRIIGYFTANKIDYIPQKEFNGLIGLRNGNLSYDFYLPNYNLLIEYQGEFHDGKCNNYVKLNLNTQKEHDRRKREYAKDHNINLLEIWYWDYDNIEKILDDYLKDKLVKVS